MDKDAAGQSSAGQDLVPVNKPCWTCAGTGRQVRYACPVCEIVDRLYGRETALHSPAAYPDAQSLLPCGHERGDTPPRREHLCPRCLGTGTVVKWLPEAAATAWALRQDTEKKRAASWAALLGLSLGNTHARGMLPQCAATTRAGHPCRRRVVPGRTRCRQHGGLSTGPVTAEGRQRISETTRESNRRRAG